MQIAKIKVFFINENIFIKYSLSYYKRICFITNIKNFYKYQQTLFIFDI